MTDNKVYQSIQVNYNKKVKMFGVLIDPDKQNVAELIKTIKVCNASAVDYFFVGAYFFVGGLVWIQH